MCGIVGCIDLAGQDIASSLSHQKAFEHAVDTLFPRGPDGSGIYTEQNVFLGHRILRIYDSSSQSDQPMADEMLGLVITYSGALYNYKSLKNQLLGYGYEFRTQSDTEVLIKAYDIWGRDDPNVFLNKLDGMFAFGVYDKKRKTILLARDRLGEKPLFYSQIDQTFFFASLPQALYPLGATDTSLNETTLYHYNMTGAFSYGDSTLFRDIKKLPHAHYMMIDCSGGISQECYWEPEFNNVTTNFHDSQSIDIIEETLFDAIEACLCGDVSNVGLFLSGGVDSTVLLSGMYQRGLRSIPTFSYGYEGLTCEDIASLPGDIGKMGRVETNEFHYSDSIAKQFKTEHTKIIISHEEHLVQLDDAIIHMPEPYPMHDILARRIIAKTAKTHGLKVVLGGEGADEVFAGYPFFAKTSEALNQKECINTYINSIYCDSPQDERDITYQAVKRLFEKAFDNSQSYLQSALYVHLMSVQPGANFGRIEGLTAHEGVEIRAPFVMQSILRAALQLPDDLRIRGGYTKFILKSVAKRYVADHLIDTPKRWSPNPAITYLPGVYGRKVYDFLNSPEALESGLFEPHELKNIANHHHMISPSGINEAFRVYVLIKWFLHHKALKKYSHNYI